jgi:hypothetical protein
MMIKTGYLLIETDDDYTGISETVLVNINPKLKFKESFCRAWEDGFMILTKMGLTACQYTILLIIIAQMEYENFCYVTQSFISEETGIAQPNVSKNINVMVKAGLLFKENTKRGKSIRVSSVIAWKGNKDKAFKEAFARDSEALIVP